MNVLLRCSLPLFAVLLLAVPGLASPSTGLVQARATRAKPASSVGTNRSALQVPSQYPTIQAAVNASQDGDTVLVADGTYSGPGNRDIDFNGKNITVTSQNGPAKTVIDCGGYASTDGSGNHRGFYIHSGEKVATISGFTVKNGYETYVSGTTDSGLGGGICVINNSNDGTITLANCIISSNTAQFDGGGILNYNNYNGNGTITLTSCTVSGNTTSGNGGGICNLNYGTYGTIATIALTNCIISSNIAQFDGGGVYIDNYRSMVTLTSCTVSSNTAQDGGGICYYNKFSTTTLLNNIIYGDHGGEVAKFPHIISNGFSVPLVSFSDIQGGYPGTGNIDADPQFVNAAAGDLHLKPGSPCLGAGTPNGAPATDLDGNTRPSLPSMGAYELAAAPATITGFTLSPNQIAAPGPKVFADVAVTGNFTKVTVSPAPGSLSTASPTFNLLTNSGGGWSGTFPTAFLKLAKTNPVTFIATGTRADGTTATMTATLQIGALPTLALAVSSDKSAVPAGQTFSVKGFVRNLTASAANSVTVTIPVPSHLTFVSSPDFTLNSAQNTITWTGSLSTNNGSHPISVEFKASANTPANTQITINVTASAANFQSITRPAYVVVGNPLVPLGVDIDASGAAGQADGTVIITSDVGTAPLLATISPVSGLEHAWLGVDHAYDANGGQLAPTTDLSIGSLAASLGLVGPGVSPTYAASFPRIGSQCNIGLRPTNRAAFMNIADIAVTAVGGVVGSSDVTPEKVLKVYNELSKIQAFKDAADQLTKPAKTPFGASVQVALIVKDLIDMNPNDIANFAAALSKVEGKEVIADRVKVALRILAAGTAIIEIGRIVADEVIFTSFTGGADAEITFTGSAARHPEELR